MPKSIGCCSWAGKKATLKMLSNPSINDNSCCQFSIYTYGICVCECMCVCGCVCVVVCAIHSMPASRYNLVRLCGLKSIFINTFYLFMLARQTLPKKTKHFFGCLNVCVWLCVCVAMPGGCCLPWGWGFIVLNQSFQVKSVGQQLMRVVIGRKLLLFSRVAGQEAGGEGSIRERRLLGVETRLWHLRAFAVANSVQFD